MLKGTETEISTGGNVPRTPPNLGGRVCFARGRGSTHGFHAIKRAGVDKCLRRARFQVGGTSKLQSS